MARGRHAPIERIPYQENDLDIEASAENLGSYRFKCLRWETGVRWSEIPCYRNGVIGSENVLEIIEIVARVVQEAHHRQERRLPLVREHRRIRQGALGSAPQMGATRAFLVEVSDVENMVLFRKSEIDIRMRLQVAVHPCRAAFLSSDAEQKQLSHRAGHP